MRIKSLKKKNDFEKVKKEGIFKSDKYLLYYISISKVEESNPVLRIGFAVSKKIGGAVVRNRIKRILREIVRNINISSNTNIDIYFIARKNIVNAEFNEIKKQLQGNVNSFLTSQ